VTRTPTLIVTEVRHGEKSTELRQFNYTLTETSLYQTAERLLTQDTDQDGWTVSALNARA